MQLITLLPILTFLGIIGISLSGLSPSSAQIDENKPSSTANDIEWKTYTNDKLGFSVEYPSNWIVKEKTNRFETGDELVIKSDESPLGSELVLNAVVSDTLFRDPALLTMMEKKGEIDDYLNLNYDRH